MAEATGAPVRQKSQVHLPLEPAWLFLLAEGTSGRLDGVDIHGDAA